MFVSPEFSYRPGLGSVSEDTNNTKSHTTGGPPNRPLPPTPDDDDQNGERTLIMKRVCIKPDKSEIWSITKIYFMRFFN